MIAKFKRYLWLFGFVLVGGLALAQTIPATNLPSEMNIWMDAIVKTESNNRPWAVLNNTYFRQGLKTGLGGFFPSRTAAEEYASKHIGMGHDLDLGKYQLNWKYQKNRPGVTLANIFDPYVQEQIGKAVLSEFYQKAKRTYGPGELAQRRAVSAYNNGNIFADNVPYLTKINKVLGKSNEGLIGSTSGRSATAAGVDADDNDTSAKGSTKRSAKKAAGDGDAPANGESTDTAKGSEGDDSSTTDEEEDEAVAGGEGDMCAVSMATRCM